MSQKPNCAACNAAIRWHKAQPTAKNPEPKMNPLDFLPNAEKGNIFIFANGEYVVLTKDALEEARAQDQPLYTSHFATCPQAGKFKRKK